MKDPNVFDELPPVHPDAAAGTISLDQLAGVHKPGLTGEEFSRLATYVIDAMFYSSQLDREKADSKWSLFINELYRLGQL